MLRSPAIKCRPDAVKAFAWTWIILFVPRVLALAGAYSSAVPAFLNPFGGYGWILSMFEIQVATALSGQAPESMGIIVLLLFATSTLIAILSALLSYTNLS